MAEGDALWALNQVGEGRPDRRRQKADPEEQDLDLKVQGLAQTLTSDLGHQKPCRFTLLLFQYLERKKQVISQPRNKEPTNDTNIYRVPTRRHLILSKKLLNSSNKQRSIKTKPNKPCESST